MQKTYNGQIILKNNKIKRHTIISSSGSLRTDIYITETEPSVQKLYPYIYE